MTSQRVLGLFIYFPILRHYATLRFFHVPHRCSSCLKMKTINTVGRTTVGIIRHCLLGICLENPRSATVRGYGVEEHRSLAEQRPRCIPHARQRTYCVVKVGHVFAAAKVRFPIYLCFHRNVTQLFLYYSN